MTLFVIDASVAAKWFLPPSGEPLAEEALRLLAGYAEGRLRFAVPDLFWGSVPTFYGRRSGRAGGPAARRRKRSWLSRVEACPRPLR